MNKNTIKICGCLAICMLFVFSTLSSAATMENIRNSPKNSGVDESKKFGSITPVNSVNTGDDYDVELSCDDPYHTVYPGDTATFVVEITNTGEYDDTYDVIAGSIEGIVCKVNGVNADQFTPYEITLAVDESTTFDVTMDVWESVSEGERHVVIEARSQSDNGVYDELVLTVNVISNYGVELSCDDPYHTVYPGDTATFVVEITNTGEYDDTYELVAIPKNIAGIFIKINGFYTGGLNPYIVSLSSGSSEILEVTVYIGSDISEYREWLVVIFAESQNDTEITDLQELTVNVVDGMICGYVYASDGVTPLEEAGVTYDFVDCIWFTDENGYYEIEFTDTGGIEQLDMYASPPSEFWDKYMSEFGVADFTGGEVGRIWVNFTLDDKREDNPPENGKIEGPTSCKVNEPYEYTFSASDPENDQIYFMVIWGDGTPYMNIYTADDEGKITVTKTWMNKGNYEIKATAIDQYCYPSEQFSLIITVAKHKQHSYLLFAQILDKFPLLARFLNIR